MMLRTVAPIFALALLIAPPAGASDSFPVTTAPLKRVTIHPSIHAYARVAEDAHYLYFKEAGNLAKLAVDVGDTVKAGQILATLDTRDIDIRLREAREALAHAKFKYDQARKLSARKAVRRDELEDRRYQYQLAQIHLAQAQDDYDHHLLKAPNDGRIVDRLVDHPGPVASSTAIFQIVSQAQPPLISARLTQSEALRIKVGDSVQIALDENPGTSLHGRISRLHPVSSSTGLVRADIIADPLPKGDHLKAGMQVEVAIASDKSETGYLVPVTALLSVEGDNAHFFAITRQRARAVTSSLLRIGSDQVLLAGDLSAYSAIVTRGQYQLTDGALVRMVGRTRAK